VVRAFFPFTPFSLLPRPIASRASCNVKCTMYLRSRNADHSSAKNSARRPPMPSPNFLPSEVRTGADSAHEPRNRSCRQPFGLHRSRRR
jgi:hypothetical protein